jgi:CRP-like cAMP-binding protein
MSQGSLEQVRSISLFQGLPDADLAALAGLCNVVELAPRDELVEESAHGDDVYGLVEGRVSIHLAMPDGRESDAIAQLRSGDTVGESILLGRTRRIATAVARDRVVALRWEGKRLLAHFDAHPATGYVVMRNLARIVLERLTATNMMLRNTLNQIVGIL